MLNLSKIPKKTLYTAAGIAVVVSIVLIQNFTLQSNLRSTTRITHNMREELEGLRQENEIFKKQEAIKQATMENLSARLNNLQQDKSLSDGRKTELKQLVNDAEKALDGQSKKIGDLETKLKKAEERLTQQRKASENLEEKARALKANPGMTPEYVKMVENEWLSAMAKTDELNKDLDRTLSELSGQNLERSKLRNDTATMHYNIAVILTEQQNYPAAIVEYEKVLEIRPEDADAHYNLAVIYDDFMKDSQNALEHYRRYIKAAPNAPEAPKVRQWIQEKEYDVTYKMKI